jgi:ribonuclease VapC
MRGPFSTPITPLTGSLFHADPQSCRLRASTASLGLSLGDRACLAQARELERPALTADKSWRAVKVKGLKVEVLR